jgi:hypothetical protein
MGISFEANRDRAMLHSLQARYQMVKNHREYGKEIEKRKPVEISFDELEWLMVRVHRLDEIEGILR